MKRVGISELKAHLYEHLHAVREGDEIVVLERGAPVARIVPAVRSAALVIRPAQRAFGSVKLPPPPKKPVDSLAALLEERGER